MIPFAAYKETINIAMQNGINLVASLLCNNDLIKCAVSVRVKFYRTAGSLFLVLACLGYADAVWIGL